jgi:hypothetical protein
MNDPELVKKVDRVLWAACAVWLLVIICSVGTIVYWILGG